MRDGPGPSQVAAWLGGNIDSALEQVAVPALLLDADGTIRWQNARFLAVFGDYRGQPFTELVAPQSSQEARTRLARKLLGTERITDYPAVYRTRSGKNVPVEVHSVALDDGTHVVGVFGIIDVDLAGPEPIPKCELTPRQLEILVALGRGYSTDQIAEELVISRETVRNHVRALLRKMKVHSRLEAVAEARRRGLIS